MFNIMNSQKNLYAMTDLAIAKELGRRLEQMRLDRHAINGKAKLEVIIGILRVLGKLENVDGFLPELPFSPIELLKLEGKKRQRATSPRTADTTRTEEDSSW